MRGSPLNGGMLHHASLPVQDLDRSAALYDAALEPLGYRRVSSGPGFAGYGIQDGKDKLALKQTAPSVPAGPGFHIALAAPSREAPSSERVRPASSGTSPPASRQHSRACCIQASRA